MSALEKAQIFDPSSPKKKFSVQFNPNTLEYYAGKRRLMYKGVREQSGQGTEREPHLQASPVEDEYGSTLSVRLFYHTYTGPDSFTDVRTDINRIRAFLPPAMTNSDSSSPKITFAWGTLTHTGTLDSFQVSYQMFAHDGTPVQAEVSISIRGEDPDVTSASNNEALGSEAEASSSQEEDDDESSLEDLSWLFEE